MPCTIMPSGRVAVTRGSFWRSEPAAALRGLANGAFPSATRRSFNSSNTRTGRYTSPRTSRSSGTSAPVSRMGTSPIVLMLGVTSSPTRPSPLVDKRDSQPVDLHLAQIITGVTHLAPHPSRPSRQLLVGERVVQALQPLQVLHWGELSADLRTDLLRR